MTVDRGSGFDSRHILIMCGPYDGKDVKGVFGRRGAGLGTKMTTGCPWRWISGNNFTFWKQDKCPVTI